MPRLIHLNGPSRVGKSTLARRYAAEHPGVLNVDIDLIVGTLDGWREDFDAALAVAARPDAIRIDTGPQTVEETYAVMLGVLEA
jgi:hypothetical protein